MALAVVDPTGRTVLRLDRPVGRSEPEHLVFVAEVPGHHLVELESLERMGGGRYRLSVVALGPASDQMRRRARAVQSLAEGHELRRGGEDDAAVESYRRAAEEWLALGDADQQADSLFWMAWCLRRDGRPEEAVEVLQRSVRGYRTSGDLERQAMALGDLGGALRHLGRGEEALARYEEALALWRRLRDSVGEARALTLIANLHKARNDLSAAERFYKAAADLWDALDRPRDVAITMANLAGVYSVAGQPELALDLLERASALLHPSGAAPDRAFVLEEMGIAHRRLGQWQKAREVYGNALSLRREAGDPDEAVVALAGLGRLQYELGEYDEALALYREAQSLVEPAGDRRREAALVHSLGFIDLHRGHPDRALASFRRVLPVFQQTGFSAGEAATLSGIARVERTLGHPRAAADWAERSLAALEKLRAGSDRVDLRTSLLATNQEDFDFAVDTLMELHRLDPEAGFAARAFHVSERGRARRLLETLPGARRLETDTAFSGPSGDSSGDPSDWGALRRRVNGAEAERLRLLAAGADEPELERAERTLRVALERLRAARERVREPGEGRRAEPHPLRLAEVQRSVLEPGSLLLSYDLGEERSYLWAVSDDHVATFVLPERRILEAAARDVRHLLAHSHHRAASDQVALEAAELSRLLLEPVAGELQHHRRLLVSVEGELHTVPFGALPDPSGRPGREEPLIARHEISYAPSASVLAWIDERPRPAESRDRKLLALLADPVFGPGDERVVRTGVGSPSAKASGRSFILGGPELERLPYSEEEALELSALVGAEDRFVATGFDARKDLVTGGGLSGFRILHFATHGWFNADHPELSALVLSRLDERGRPRDGALWAHEISSLHLAADLVVLSACDTALGSRIHGEGLVGLSHAFFQAGAPRVLVSLWRVDDQAAVDLMKHFYRGFLRQGLPAAEALRRAQLALRADPRWSRPFYWAGFVLQGAS